MNQNLAITLGQCSIAGVKSDNDDFYGAITPKGVTLDSKGIAVVIADGVSASEGGKEASQIAVKQFLSDYYSTPDSWTVKTAINKVVSALNLWLCSQGQRQYGGSGGMATTFSGLIFKSHTAYLFHIGDSRLYRWQSGKLECLTKDHRVQFAGERSYLTRALGIDVSLEIDFRVLELQQGDVFVQKAPASTVGDLAQALKELFGCDNPVRVIGTRHGEKLYESLVSREEMAKAEDMGRYYRIPADNRDLNYKKYFVEGEEKISGLDDYTSHNTQRLDVAGIKTLLRRLDYIREQLDA